MDRDGTGVDEGGVVLWDKEADDEEVEESKDAD